MLTIKVNLEAMEAMMYFWQSTSDRQKVNERFLNDVAAMPAFQLSYDEEFTAESVRKVLSAITNREPFRPSNRKEGRFFNNNLRMLEDLELTSTMLQPIKTLNLDLLAAKLGADNNEHRDLVVHFAPLHLEEFHMSANTLALNFFLLQVGLDGKVSYAGQDLLPYVEEKCRRVLA